MRSTMVAVLVAAVLLTALQGAHAAGQCHSGIMVNGTDHCFAYVNGSFYMPENATVAAVQSTIQTDISLLVLIKLANPACHAAATWMLCNTAYPGCENDAPMKVCRTNCEAMYNACSETFTGPYADRLPDCTDNTKYADADCRGEALNLPEPGPPESCPSPLIVDPYYGMNVSNSFCNSGCCVPCPQANYLFPTGVVRTIDTVINAIGLVSFFCALYVAVGYALLAKKRAYPSVIILYIAIACVLFYIPDWYNVAGYDLVKCDDPVTPAHPGTTNIYALSSAFFTIYGVMLAAMWYGFLVLNIFLSVVFMWQNLDLYWYIWTPICFLVPLVFPIVAIVSNSIGYQFGTRSTPSRGAYFDGTMMIPLAVIIWPSTILNLWVVAKIAIVGRRRNAELKTILRLQMRPLIFALIVLLIFMFFWVYDRTVFDNYSNVGAQAEWVPEWFMCIMSGRGQDECSAISTPHLFNLVGYTISEILISIIGIVVVLFFGLKRDIVFGLLNLCRENKLNTGSYSRSSKNSSSGTGTGTGTGIASKSTEEELITMQQNA